MSAEVANRLAEFGAAAWTPVRVALARLHARPARGAVAAAGVAAATAMLLAVLGGSVVAADRGVAHALDGLPADERAFTAGWFGLPPGGDYAAIDRDAVAGLARLSPSAPRRALVLRELRFGRHVVQLGAVAPLAPSVSVVAGRLPGACRPARCEVVAGGRTPRVLRVRGLRLVVVGRARVRGALPFERATGRRPPALLLAGDVRGLSAVPALALIYRTYAWQAPVDPDGVRAWEVDDLLLEKARVENGLAAKSSLYGLRAPSRALDEARAAGEAAARRLLVVGGEAAVLLLAVVLLAAGALARDLGAEWTRLERRGARRAQLWALAGAETGAVTLVGALAGVALGAAATALVAARAGADVTGVLAHSLATPAGAAVILAAWAAATAIVLGWYAIAEHGGASGRALDLLALGALGAAALAASRGSAGAASLRESPDPLLALLPLLVALVAGIATVRLLAPALRAADRAARHGPVAIRLALLALARDAARPALTVAFLVACLGAALFAQSYRDTLVQGQRDQARFQVPLDAAVTAGPALVEPLDAAPLARYRAIPARPVPVLRRSGTIPSAGARPIGATVLGVPAPALAGLPGWRSDFAALPADELARRIAPAGETALRGAPLGSAARVRLRAATDGPPVRLALVVQAPAPGAGVETLSLGLADRRPRRLQAAVPASLRAGRVVALEVARTAATAQASTHQDAEGGSAFVTAGTLALSSLRAAGGGGRAVVADWRGWIGRGGLAAVRDGALGFRIGGDRRPFLRPRQPADDAPVPAIVSADVAAVAPLGTTLQLRMGAEPVAVRVAAVARRFPTIDDGSFVVADEGALAGALEAADPGTGTPGELWLGAPRGSAGALAAALARPPFDALRVRARAAVEADLRDDPLARGVLAILAATAVVALVLAAAGVVLMALAMVRDERGELYDLEAQGVEPAALRRQLQLRAALLVALGVAGGTALGLVLARFVVDLVRLGAGVADAQPPLVPVTRWALVAAAALAFTAAVAVAVALVTRAAVRGRVPRPPAGLAP
jgi:hypothetical protein